MKDSILTLTYNECAALLTALLKEGRDGAPTNKGLRNYAMGLVMLDAGLRVSEISKLRRSHFYYGKTIKNSLIVTADIAKRNFERTIPVSERLKQAIENLYAYVWKDETDYLHCYAFHKTNPERPLSTRQIQRIIHAASLKAIGRPIHPHILRHTFATRLMKTCNTSVVQKLLGHKHLSSTQIYCHPDAEDLKQAIESISV